MSGSRWVITSSWLSGSWISFLLEFFCVFSTYSYYLLLLLGPYCFCPLCVSIFAWNVPLVSLIFLKRSLVFPILLFPSISLHWSLKKTFLSLLAILWNSAFSWVYLSLSPLPFTSLLFSAKFVKPPQTTTLPSCISLGWFWSTPTVQCYKPQSIALQALYHSNPLNLFVTSTIITRDLI